MMGGAKRWDLHTPASDADRAMDDKQDVAIGAIDVLAATSVQVPRKPHMIYGVFHT